MSVTPESVAASALRDWLLLKLPAKTLALNNARNASITMPFAGPYEFVGGVLERVKFYDGLGDPGTDVIFGLGVQTATATAGDINTVYPGMASVDAADRLVITAADFPIEGTMSYVAMGPGSVNSALSVFGLDDLVASNTRAFITAPGPKNILDGWPVVPDFTRGMTVIIGDRLSEPAAQGNRLDINNVTLDLAIMGAERNTSKHRDREHIQSCVRAVREVLQTDEGRQLGRQSYGDVMFVQELSCRISGIPFSFKRTPSPNELFDIASMTLMVRVFERPDQT